MKIKGAMSLTILCLFGKNGADAPGQLQEKALEVNC